VTDPDTSVVYCESTRLPLVHHHRLHPDHCTSISLVPNSSQPTHSTHITPVHQASLENNTLGLLMSSVQLDVWVGFTD